MNSELELGSVNIHLILRQSSKTLLTHSRKYIICWCVSRIKHAKLPGMEFLEEGFSKAFTVVWSSAERLSHPGMLARLLVHTPIVRKHLACRHAGTLPRNRALSEATIVEMRTCIQIRKKGSLRNLHEM